MASLVPVDHPVGCKPNNKLPPGRENLNEPALKRRRSNEPDKEHIPSTLPSQTEQDAPVPPAVAEGEVIGFHEDSLAVEKERSDAPGLDDGVMVTRPEEGLCTEAFLSPGGLQPPPRDLLSVHGVRPVPPSPCGDRRVSGLGDVFRSPPDTLHLHNCVASNQSLTGETISPRDDGQSDHTSPLVCKHVDGFRSDAVEDIKTSERFPFPSELFWRNSANLCWLDSILVALVNCKSLKKCRPDVEPQRSAVWRLIREHEDIGSAVHGHQQSGRGKSATRAGSHLRECRIWHMSLLVATFDGELDMSGFGLSFSALHCSWFSVRTPISPI